MGEVRGSSTKRVRRALAAAVVALALGGSLAACSSVHQGLGTSDAACFTALPRAAAAVGSHARFGGVRLLKVSAIPYKTLAAIVRSATSADRVCLVDYIGDFTAAKVSHPRGRSTGRFAVVVLTFPKGDLVATVLFRRVPVRFQHTHVG